MSDEKQNLSPEISKGSAFPFVSYIFPLLHLLVVLPLAYYLNIWVDEASTLNSTANGLFATLENALSEEKQAPLYFALLSLWRNVSETIFFARFFSITCSVLAIVFFYRLVLTLWNSRIAVVTTLLFSIHPYLVWASLEIRVYSLVILLTVVLLNLFIEGYLDFGEDGSQTEINSGRTSRYMFAVAALLSIYVYYYLGFILVGCFLGLALLRRWREAKIYLVQMLLVGLLILPLAWSIKSQLAVRNTEVLADSDLIGGIRILWGHFLLLILPTEVFPPESITYPSYIRLWVARILGPAAAVGLLIRRRLFDKKIVVFSGISIFVLAMLYYTYFLLGASMVSVRHVSVLFAPLILLLVSVLMAMAPRSKAYQLPYFLPITIVFLASYTYGLFSLYPDLTKRGDWVRVSRYIEQNESENQRILVFPNFEAQALPYYYKGRNQVLPKDNFHKWFAEAEYGTEGTWTKQIEHYISLFSNGSSEIWLVTHTDCHTTKACIPLEKFIEANYNVVLQKDFYGERVRLMEKND